MRTVGVDLAAEPGRTAVAAVEWTAGHTELVHLQLGVDDADLLALIRGADKAGIDCPLGWPDPFVELVTRHHTGHLEGPFATDLAWRRTLARRATDLHVADVTGLHPLSVSTDRIGAVAVRAASLLGSLAAQGEPVDRSGSGVVAEVYPAAALRRWELTHRGYKRAANVTTLGALLDGTRAALPGLDLGTHEQLLLTSDDAFDALVCALVARAAAVGAVEPVPAELLDRARREGWILLPSRPLTELK